MNNVHMIFKEYFHNWITMHSHVLLLRNSNGMEGEVKMKLTLTRLSKLDQYSAWSELYSHHAYWIQGWMDSSPKSWCLAQLQHRANTDLARSKAHWWSPYGPRCTDACYHLDPTTWPWCPCHLMHTGTHLVTLSPCSGSPCAQYGWSSAGSWSDSTPDWINIVSLTESNGPN